MLLTSTEDLPNHTDHQRGVVELHMVAADRIRDETAPPRELGEVDTE
jgi:hypothetical protein